MSRLKPVFKHADVEKSKFKQSRCLLTISVGQEVHEKEHFERTVELVNVSFDSCIMLIDDSLQRHTMALASERDADSFYQRSIEAGNQWLERNAVYYERLEILDKVIRWDHWLMHSDFQAQQDKIKSLISSNHSYKIAFINTVDAFLNRYFRRIKDKTKFNLEGAQQFCLNYLIEECTALCLWPELACHFEVYPSRRNLAMAETHKRFVLPQYPDFLHAVSIKFKNRKQFQPQELILMKKD